MGALGNWSGVRAEYLSFDIIEHRFYNGTWRPREAGRGLHGCPARDDWITLQRKQGVWILGEVSMAVKRPQKEPDLIDLRLCASVAG